LVGEVGTVMGTIAPEPSAVSLSRDGLLVSGTSYTSSTTRSNISSIIE
jgi:hypothetical protein